MTSGPAADESVRSYYETTAERYRDDTEEGRPTTRAIARSIRTAMVLDAIVRHAPAGGTVADIGCGPAQLTPPLLARGFRYIGLDIAPRMYRAMAERLGSDPRVRFLEGSAEALPLAAASVDVATLVGVVEYLDRDDAWIAESHRVLRPGGVLIVTFPNLLNPIQAVRTLLRPVVAPFLRAVAPGSALASTVYVSGITDRPFVPPLLFRRLERSGFDLREWRSNGFHPFLRDHQLDARSVRALHRTEAIGARRFPLLGANVVVALRPV